MPNADELNRTIVDLAVSIGGAERADVNVLHAWRLYGESLLESRMDDEERLAAVEALDTLVEEFGDRAAEVRQIRHASHASATGSTNDDRQ